MARGVSYVLHRASPWVKVMNNDPKQTIALHHPATHRNRVGLSTLLFGLCAAPLAWSIQLLLSTALAGHACFPERQPIFEPASPLVFWMLLAIGIGCFILAILGGLVAWKCWRLTREEASGGARHLLDSGRGRTRFLSMFGILTSAIFLMAIAFSTAAVFTEPLCR